MSQSMILKWPWKDCIITITTIFYTLVRYMSLMKMMQKKLYNPQIQISAESGTKRSIFRQKNKTKRSKKKAAHNTYKAGTKG